MWHVDTTGLRSEGNLAASRMYTNLPGGVTALVETFLKEIQFVPGMKNVANVKKKQK